MPASSSDRSLRQFRLPFEVDEAAPAPDPPPAPIAVAPAPPPLPSIPPDPPEPQPPPRLVVRYVRNPRARRYIIRVRPGGIVRVTIPRGGSQGGAASFVYEHRAWVDDQLERLRRAALTPSRPLAAGDRVLLRGIPTTVTVEPVHHGRVKVRLGDAPACLMAPASDLRPAVTAMLRALARRVLPERLMALAATHGLTVTRVSVRDQQSRWGSCSATGSISLNFRLVQMPPEVCDYVLVHELMHLREANHSRRFWKHVARACPWHLAARAWLNREGRALL